MRPRLAARLGLALCGEVRHSLHRLVGSYDTDVFSGQRLPAIGNLLADPLRSGSGSADYRYGTGRVVEQG